MTPFKVLLVSADARLREELAALLLRNGLVVDQAASVKEAKARCTELRCPDLVVVDSASLDNGGEQAILDTCRSRKPSVLVLVDPATRAHAREHRGPVRVVTRPATVHAAQHLSSQIADMAGH